jgi:hypothetical protein
MSPHFPYECSDEELQEKIAEYAERVQSSSTTETLQWRPLLQLGLIEQQNRQTRRSNTTSRRVVRCSCGVAPLHRCRCPLCPSGGSV